MSLLADVNGFFGGLIPAWAWDWLQVAFGALVTIGVIFQRRYSERFQSSSITCPLDALTVRAGQVGLAGIGTLAFLVMVDGLLPSQAPPRAFVIMFLAAYSAIQVRVLHDALAQFHKPRHDID